MTQTPSMLDLNPAAQEVKKVLSGITTDQLAAPTPCAGTSVAVMLDHFMSLTIAFTDAARKAALIVPGGQTPAGPPQASADHLNSEWRRELPVQLETLVPRGRNREPGRVTLPLAE